MPVQKGVCVCVRVCLCLSETEGASEAQREGEGGEIDLCAPWPRASSSASPPFLPPPPPPPRQRYGSLTCGALAAVGVDLVDTCAAVQAGAIGALVRIDLTELPPVTWPISKGGSGREMDWLDRDTVRSIFTWL